MDISVLSIRHIQYLKKFLMKKKLYHQTHHHHNFNPPSAKYQYIGTPLNQYNDLYSTSMSMSTALIKGFFYLR